MDKGALYGARLFRFSNMKTCPQTFESSPIPHRHPGESGDALSMTKGPIIQGLFVFEVKAEALDSRVRGNDGEAKRLP
ncbi:hypothetical protein [Dyella sp. C11]|uniref:hypothetical protein n=1 Tax=Dyella sp. C11 TaxID=2126991 RepID=UPI0013006605|nr:hypothetical protein [Dyella sp. C11]